MQELPTNRLATTDETGRRLFLYPAAVSGWFKRRKQWVHTFLILLFLALPWIYVNGQQLLFLNVAKREFLFFSLHLRAHDAPLLLFFLLSFAFLIGLITTLWGRIWCGWACPQTVFIDSFFRRIEEWIEGNHRQRKELDEAPWTQDKVLKKSLKYGAFLLASLIITHSFLAYFVGSRELLGMIQSSPLENWPSFLVIAFTTAVILFDFGWFREQFCVIACPYGRFQSVLIDSHSLIVGYDTRRGEPRRDPQNPTAPAGDCVSCFRCVQVCPTGIDIRRGLQMECIGCTACIDACDTVMEKIHKPSGLIRYTSQAELAGEKKTLRPRPFVYAALLLAALTGLGIALSQKEFLDATVLRAGDAPYQVLKNGDQAIVVNHFRVDLSNQTGKDQSILFSLAPPAVSEGAELVMPINPMILADRATARADFFVRIPEEKFLNGKKLVTLNLSFAGETKPKEVPLVGPNR